ncbi:MAG: hypothetical protein KDB58_13660 [Solirubrobacterales bacterium]|nr:hypothetical protein [Solirubrobacterales bacterium]MCB8969418.1 adenylate/guanylate cyclase domain-containing protein [Thermoleophilales bacterium]MCO5327324.1 adenylate/guanylate cyclase domain-containing protein [Solirubrobacterales bacterium]
MRGEPDFEAEGLLDGVSGVERESRLELLRRLWGDGIDDLEALRTAVSEGRLTVLPVERALVGEPRYTSVELAELSGMSIEDLEHQWRSIGIAVPARDERAMSREDLEAAHRQRALLDAGITREESAELGRMIAVAMSQFAAASRQVLASTVLRAGDSEADASRRIVEQTESLLPLVAPTLDYVYRLHLREQLRHAALISEVMGNGTAPGAETVTIAFADLVGYTRLGEDVPPEELGRVTGRLDEVARDVAGGPVRLVKLIGDAAMLSSADTTALLGSVLDLVAEMAEEGEGYPLIRAGVARGDVLSRAGDYYGATVNLASRITGIARPGSVLTTKEVRDEAGDEFAFSAAGRKHLKGIQGAVELHRCRDLDDPDAKHPGKDEGERRGEEGGDAGAGPAEPPRDSRSRRRRRARRS